MKIKILLPILLLFTFLLSNSALDYPYAIECISDSICYISDWHSDQIYVLDSQENVIIDSLKTESKNQFFNVSAIRKKDDKLYILEEDLAQVTVISLVTKKIEKLFDLRNYLIEMAVDMEIDSENSIWILDKKKGELFCFDENGSLLKEIKSYRSFQGGEVVNFSEPEDIAVNGDMIVVADTQNKKIVFLNKDGNTLNIISYKKGKNNFFLPLSVNFYRENFLITLDGYDNSLNLIDFDGKNIFASFENFDIQNENFLKIPKKVCLFHDNILMLNDLYDGKIKKFYLKTKK